jgi:hypothetical protein
VGLDLKSLGCDGLSTIRTISLDGHTPLRTRDNSFGITWDPIGELRALERDRLFDFNIFACGPPLQFDLLVSGGGVLDFKHVDVNIKRAFVTPESSTQ